MHSRLSLIERSCGFQCYDGQREFILRLARERSGIVAADCGAGKSLMATTLAQLFDAKRIWIIAPKGTTACDDGSAQWIKEIRAFAPFHAVFTLSGPEDLERIASANCGQPPHGFYVSHHEAAFVTGGVECRPKTWTDGDLSARLDTFSVLPGSVDTIGLERGGIRCIFRPCLATLAGNLFDMVVVDECHKIGTDTIAHQMLHRLQPRHRWAFSATPMMDKPEDILPVLEWVERED
jgi:superfamily II DNA or RNA helicase